VHFFLEPGMRNHQLAAVEHVVTDETIQKFGSVAAKLR
jgi:hypothetical protein